LLFSIAFIAIAKPLALTNLTVGLQRNHFTHGKDKKTAKVGIHTVKVVVLHFDYVQVVDDGVLARNLSRKLIVVQDQHVDATIAQFGNKIKGQFSRQAIVVEVEYAETEELVATTAPVEWNRSRQIVVSEVEVKEIP